MPPETLKTKNKDYKDKLKCLLCGKSFGHLGSHIWHRHKVKAREYKEQFGLPYDMALISEEIYRKKRDAFNEHREKYLKNFQASGTEFQFKKGHPGERRVSEHERKVYVERIKQVNKGNETMKPCPVCKMQFRALESHLYNAHKMIKVD